MSFSLDKLISQLGDKLPTELGAIKDDICQHVRAILQNQLRDMNLVTREEFEIQTQVLARTREKLEALEKILLSHQASGSDKET